MRKVLTITLIAAASALALSACNNKEVQTEPPAAAEVVLPATLADVMAHTRRDEERARDQFRHPKETLEFLEVAPGKHVVEIWPGWYSNIIGPYLKENDGMYSAALYHESQGERAMERVAAYKEKYGNPDVYGAINFTAFSKESGLTMDDSSADVILTFRNVHNWMGSDYADKAFADFARVLKPGGILGVVEHRLPETMEQDPRGATGYVQESYMKELAESAGLEFAGSSEVNANPRDTADHPFGVWTLPPRSRLPEEGSVDAADFNAEIFKNIGESDRATLKFRKPDLE